MARSDISRWPACCPQSSDRQVSAGYSAYARVLVATPTIRCWRDIHVFRQKDLTNVGDI